MTTAAALDSQRDLKLLGQIASVVATIGLALVALGASLSPANLSTVRTVLAGYSILGAAVLFLMCAQLYAAGAHPWTANLRMAAPYLVVAGLAAWAASMVGVHQHLLASNNVAPSFYTYFLASVLCTAIEVAAIFRMTAGAASRAGSSSGSGSGSGSNSGSTRASSVAWSLLMLVATLNGFANTFMHVILTDYVTQG